LRQARAFAPIYIKWLKEPPAEHDEADEPVSEN